MSDPSTPKSRKPLDQIRDAIRVKHYSYSTEKTNIHQARRYILFYNKRHPAEIGAQEIETFLTHLAKDENVSASTQNQALSAVLFLYRHVLEIKLDEDAMLYLSPVLKRASAFRWYSQKTKPALSSTRYRDSIN